MSTSAPKSSRPRGEDWCDDEIDLLEVARTLWRGRYWIAGATVALALLAWAISVWWLPPRYQAAAYLVLHPWPEQIADLTLPAPPDIQSLTSLAQEEAVLQRAFGDDSRPLQTTVQSVGADGFRLLVTASDPEEAAQGANRWAEVVMAESNYTYGLLEWQRDLEAERQRLFEDYQAAEERFAARLATSRVAVLESHLNALTREYTCVERRLADIADLTRALQQLRTRWSVMPAEESVPVQDALLFLNLSQQGWSLSLCGLEAPPLQLQVTAEGPGFNVAQGLRSLEALEDLLAEQTQRLEQRHEALEAQIAQVAAALSTAREEQDQARRMRDWAWERYTRIVDLTRALETWQMTERPLVSVGMHAVPPSEPVSPRPVLNAIVAGMSGFFLSSMAVLMTSWWASRSDAIPSEQEDDS